MPKDPTLVGRIVDAFPAAFWAAIGGLLTHIWHRFRSRMVTLRCQASHQSLGVSTQDALFGSIEIRYNSEPVDNLFMTSVELQNQSNTDLKDVIVNLLFLEGTLIYMSHGAVTGSANLLPFADPFEGDLDRFNRLPEGDSGRQSLLASLLRRRDYRIPILNRGAHVKIAMLVQARQNQRPFVQVACDHSGVRLVFQGPQDLVFGVQRGVAALTGLATGLAAVIALVSLPVDPKITALVALLLGALCAAIGAGLVRAFRWVLRTLG